MSGYNYQPRKEWFEEPPPENYVELASQRDPSKMWEPQEQGPDPYGINYKKMLEDAVKGAQPYSPPAQAPMTNVGGGNPMDRGLSMLSKPVSTDWGQGQSASQSQNITSAVLNQVLNGSSI